MTNQTTSYRFRITKKLGNGAVLSKSGRIRAENMYKASSMLKKMHPGYSVSVFSDQDD